MGPVELLLVPLVFLPVPTALAVLVAPPVVMARRHAWTRPPVLAWLGGVVAVVLWQLSGVLDAQVTSERGPVTSGPGVYAWIGDVGWLLLGVVLAIVSVRRAGGRGAVPAG